MKKSRMALLALLVLLLLEAFACQPQGTSSPAFEYDPEFIEETVHHLASQRYPGWHDNPRYNRIMALSADEFEPGTMVVSGILDTTQYYTIEERQKDPVVGQLIFEFVHTLNQDNEWRLSNIKLDGQVWQEAMQSLNVDRNANLPNN